MKEKIKRYSFWTTLAGSSVIIASVIGKIFGFQIENEIISDAIIAFAGLLVALGVVIPDDKQEKLKEDEKTESDDEKQSK